MIESTLLRSIRANLIKSVETTLYETLRDCVDTVMTDEHIPNEALTDMLLSSMSSATNLISLEESIHSKLWLGIFLIASHDW